MTIDRRTWIRLLTAGSLVSGAAMLAACGSQATAPTVKTSPPSAPAPESPGAAESPTADRLAGPPRVRVERRSGRYGLFVDGAELRIHGMGYNVLYQQRGLAPSEREARLRRDFELLRSAGINLIQSWQEPEVDDLHMRLAHEHGLHVIPYYHFPRMEDYADPAVQAVHRREVRDWMERWRTFPAVTIWGIGNEVLLAASRAEAKTFAAFYVTVVQDALQLDPTRPVTYREAEDVMVPHFRDAFAAAGGVPDQFIYGLNFYTPRLADVLDNWQQHQFDVPLFVSEFSPTGLPLDERPDGFKRLWSVIDGHRDRVLGGAVYTWTTEGPEATDHIFGLVNDEDHPLDASLLALSELWGGSYGQPQAQQVTVPRLVGQVHGAARAEAYATGLFVETVQSAGLSSLPATVRAQRPRSGVVVPRGSTIRIVMPSQPVASESTTALSSLFAAARDVALGITGEPLAGFEQDRAAAEAEAQQELEAMARSEQDRERTAQLAEWRGWLETLAVIEHNGDELFPGAINIIPVFKGLARFAMQDARAFTQAESFARAAVAEWVAAARA